MPYKITWFFECLEQSTRGGSVALGWTETFYSNTDVTIDNVFSLPDVVNYQTKRLAILPSQYRIPWVRVSNEPTVGPGSVSARLVKVASINLQGQIVGQAPNPFGIQTTCALLIDLQRLPDTAVPTDKVHHRKFLLRGLPPDVVNGNIINDKGNSWNAVKAFLDFIGQTETPVPKDGRLLHAATLGCRYQDTSLTAFNATLLQGVGSPQQFWACAPDVPAWNAGPPTGPFTAQGTRVRFTRVQAPYEKALSGKIGILLSRLTVGGVTQMTFGRTKKDLPSDIINTGVPCVMQQVGYKYGPFSQYAIIGMRVKKTGRLFHQPRGRSSNRP